jgi:hypothetical protein
MLVKEVMVQELFLVVLLVVLPVELLVKKQTSQTN